MKVVMRVTIDVNGERIAFFVPRAGEPVITLRQDGSVSFASGYSPDEMTRTIWEGLGPIVSQAGWVKTPVPEAGKEPIPVWAVNRHYEPVRAWAFYSEKREGWAVYDGEGFAIPDLGGRIGWPNQLPDGVFMTREEALDAALTDAVQSLNDLETEEPKRIAEVRRRLQEAIARLEREVALDGE